MPLCSSAAFATSVNLATSCSFLGGNITAARPTITRSTAARSTRVVCSTSKKNDSRKGENIPRNPDETAKAPSISSSRKAKASSPFAGMAAGPGAKPQSLKRMSKRVSDTNSTSEVDPSAEKDSAREESEMRADHIAKQGTLDAPVKRPQKGVLGRARRKPQPEIDTRKTAADFIAEGVVDDVDDSFQAFTEQDIRFGVEDDKDPFRISEDNAADKGPGTESLIGKPVDLAGDGAVTKVLLKEGAGEFIGTGATVTVDYTGKLDDGKVFDSSKNREGGFSFALGQGQVIKGWEAGVATMRKGEIAEFTIASNYAYGRRGMPPVIPGSATLTFEIEVLDVRGGVRNDSDDGMKNMSESNPATARTIDDINIEYEKRLASQKERRSKMTFLDRFYIISPFASQTGQRPPWYLNPNITFFIVFVTVAISFYVVLSSGGIHYGYVKDPVEIDILTK